MLALGGRVGERAGDGLIRRVLIGGIIPTIVFIHPDGARQTVAAETGRSVMRAAMTHDIGAILAECGGAAACATCHVYVDPRPGLPPRSRMEDDMLEMTAEPQQPNSRLSCQIFMDAALDGIEVRLPKRQV